MAEVDAQGAPVAADERLEVADGLRAPEAHEGAAIDLRREQPAQVALVAAHLPADEERRPGGELQAVQERVADFARQRLELLQRALDVAQAPAGGQGDRLDVRRAARLRVDDQHALLLLALAEVELDQRARVVRGRRCRELLRPVQVWNGSSYRAREFVATTKELTFARSVGLPGQVWGEGKAAWVADLAMEEIAEAAGGTGIASS